MKTHCEYYSSPRFETWKSMISFHCRKNSHLQKMGLLQRLGADRCDLFRVGTLKLLGQLCKMNTIFQFLGFRTCLVKCDVLGVWGNVHMILIYIYIYVQYIHAYIYNDKSQNFKISYHILNLLFTFFSFSANSS